MSFHRWLAISGIIHAAVIAPFALSDLGTFEERRTDNLRIDLFEMMADQDQEEKKKAGDPLAPEEAAVPKPPAPRPKTEVTRIEEELRPAPPSPTEYLPEMAEIPLEEYFMPEIPTFAPSVPEGGGVVGGTGTSDVPVLTSDSGAGGGGRGSGGTDDVDQTTTRRGRSGPVDPFAAYTAMVARRLQDNLIYPSEMRRKGVEGKVTIVFTIAETGRIKRGSLKVRESSGHDQLDNGALRSARASEPFMKPPRREMTLAIEVSFEAESRKGG